MFQSCTILVPGVCVWGGGGHLVVGYMLLRVTEYPHAITPIVAHVSLRRHNIAGIKEQALKTTPNKFHVHISTDTLTHIRK